jgi:AraC-like DNA-binding protein
VADVWTSVDPLGEALQFLRMSAVLYCQSEFTAPWGVALPPVERCMMFHVVTSGQCWLEVNDTEPTLLQAGDMALVPHGRGHRLLHEPGAATAKLFDLPRESVSERYEILRHGAGGAITTMLCGVVRFDNPAADQLIRLLPRTIRVDGWNSREMEWIGSTLRLVTAEARELRAGAETVLTRLADIFVIQAIRWWVAHEPSGTGWIAAFRDKQIGSAVALIHRDPTRNWSVASLAAAVGMSRSAFAARFTQLVGEPAVHYATQCKMNAAHLLLKENNGSLAELSARLGYKSEAAFSRAFKRFTGVPPGAVRRNGPAAPELLAEIADKDLFDNNTGQGSNDMTDTTLPPRAVVNGSMSSTYLQAAD